VEHARHKLQGRHPADILLAELAPRHGGAKYWKALQVGPCMLPGLLSPSKCPASVHDCAGVVQAWEASCRVSEDLFGCCARMCAAEE
jgi:hypothetical protein